jgi:hypothetical protein
MEVNRLFIDLLTNSGRIETVPLPPDVVNALSSLVECPDAYFRRTASSALVPVELLVASRIRNEGVINANRLMLLAAKGAVSKRSPVRIRRVHSRFLVLDGNSTFINAKFSNWQTLLCEIVQC